MCKGAGIQVGHIGKVSLAPVSDPGISDPGIYDPGIYDPGIYDRAPLLGLT